MPVSVIADAGFLVALLSRRDACHNWALAKAAQFGRPWRTCEAVLVEAFYLLGPEGSGSLVALLRRTEVTVSFQLNRDQGAVLALMQKYADVPMSFADACLVRMTETHADPVVVTTGSHFRIYRRHGRRVVPCVMPE